jgi:hypothetical protein
MIAFGMNFSGLEVEIVAILVAKNVGKLYSRQHCELEGRLHR